MTPPDPLPVTLLTGFLGAGKTTLVNRVLREHTRERFAVVVNEFGDVGVDGELVV
ncbi:MAG: GTP-binding protein, partial [Planctomycetes bacterium]|nr:GTP-binding protein [Planctomycetota bacterium]